VRFCSRHWSLTEIEADLKKIERGIAEMLSEVTE